MICFSIANKCNWDCDYCISGTQSRYNKDKPNPNEEDFSKLLNSLNENSTIMSRGSDKDLVLSGGEPGLYSPDEIIEILKSIHPNINLTINTNGLFLEKINPIIWELLIYKFKSFNFRWHILQDASSIFDNVDDITRFITRIERFSEYLSYGEFQIIITQKEIENKLIYSDAFKNFIFATKKYDSNFRLIVTPDYNLKGHKSELIRLLPKLNSLNSEYSYKKHFKNSSKPTPISKKYQVIDIEKTEDSFNHLLNFSKKEPMFFKSVFKINKGGTSV